MKIAEYHSKEPKAEVYHNNNQCTVGNNIERRYWTRGRGNKKRICYYCKHLNQSGK